MLARVYTAAMEGLSPVKIEVEVDGISGTPNFILIGLAAKAVEEAKERVTAALQNCGIRIRAKRTVVNLAPADLQKTGTAFELAIAVGLLKMFGEVTIDTNQTMFFGELSLDGQLKPVPGILPLVIAARNMGFKNVVIPKSNVKEISVVTGINVLAISHLVEYIDHSQGKKPISKFHTQKYASGTVGNAEYAFEDIGGQNLAKRALQIAAAGGHNLHFIGPPGGGKTMLAKSLVSILPPLTESEAIEVTSIHSIAGLSDLSGLISARPFRSPHHTVSTAGLIGGGSDLRPGEISLAHRGVLFLDEFPEFKRSSIEALRQPIEDGCVRITRAKGAVQYPAQFSLIAASNPCPCGYFNSKIRSCGCGKGKRKLYAQRLSGPVLDRIDLHLWVQSEKSKLEEKETISSSHILDSILDAHQRQLLRYRSLHIHNNATVPSSKIDFSCPRSLAAKRLLRQAQYKYKLTTRSYFKIIKVARTIADLDKHDIIQRQHVAEALQFRPRQLLS